MQDEEMAQDEVLGGSQQANSMAKKVQFNTNRKRRAYLYEFKPKKELRRNFNSARYILTAVCLFLP